MEECPDARFVTVFDQAPDVRMEVFPQNVCAPGFERQDHRWLYSRLNDRPCVGHRFGSLAFPQWRSEGSNSWPSSTSHYIKRRDRLTYEH